MGRTTLGAFRLAPLGIVAAKSGHAPARALLNHRQARYAQRIHNRPRGGDGPEEFLEGEGAALTACLRAAASLHPGDTVETQKWGTWRIFFPGQIVVDTRKGAPDMAGSWRWGNTSRSTARGSTAEGWWHPATG